MPAFALYRLPHTDTAHFVAQTTGEPAELLSCASLNGREGFVIAPFHRDQEHPYMLIEPDVRKVTELDQLQGDKEMTDFIHHHCYDRPAADRPMHCDKMHYRVDFANFHSHIVRGDFSKIVLARQVRMPKKEERDVVDLFCKTCEKYPRLFIALVSAQRCGTWLMATPEILLEGKGKEWLTISLAGTMRLAPDQMDFDVPPSKETGTVYIDTRPDIRWSVKDIQEQRFVSTYITECLEGYASSLQEKGPFTMRAGDLVHLRSDFHFTLPNTDHIGDLLSTLYPTPAVCGVPKEATRDFILYNEYAHRCYYSGFVGLLSPEEGTHLFVSLRCMRIDSDGYSLFAGGGLLADSQLEQEWEETEAKLMTIGSVI